MKIRKILALLLSAVLMLGILAACGPQETTNTTGPSDTGTSSAPPPPPSSPSPSGQLPGTTPTPTDAPPETTTAPLNFNTKVPRDTFMVGTPEMNGDFIFGWGNSSYDLYIKTLTGGYYNLYYGTPEGQIALNPTVVKDVSTSLDADGNKTYTFVIHDDLKWNNGNPITAKDYVACILVYESPSFLAAGASSEYGLGLLGNGAYQTGESNVHAGVRLISDYSFSLTIDAEELPYFWETAFVSSPPIPMAKWLPGLTIINEPGGSRLSGNPGNLILRVSETERFAPTVSCGPYMFISFDGSTVTLQRNPYFKGDPNGNLPEFEWVIQTTVNSEVDVDLVIGGDLDMVGGVIEGPKIEAARASEFAVDHSYLRAGYGFLGFQVDFPPVDDANVRWAIACMIDRNTIIDHVLGGYGGLVDGAFGMAQWTYQARRRELQQRLQPIAFNLDKANDFLDQSIWIYEADGVTPFDRTKVNAEGTYMRHNSNREMLVIHHISGSPSVGGAIESETLKNSPLIGMKYEITMSDFGTLLDHWYDGASMGADRYYHAFNLATNFSVTDDKYVSWHSDFADIWWNANNMRDDEIDRLSIELRRVDPTDTEKFADIWVDFLVRLQSLMPEIPLYSNEYFDIHNSVVIGLTTSPYANYCDVICDIHKWP